LAVEDISAAPDRGKISLVASCQIRPS